MPKDLNGVEGATAEDRLRQYVDRILRLQAEQAELAADIREVKAEAKAAGYDSKALNEMVKLGKLDATDRSEREAIRDLYRATVFPEFGTAPKRRDEKENTLSGSVPKETPAPTSSPADGGLPQQSVPAEPVEAASTSGSRPVEASTASEGTQPADIEIPDWMKRDRDNRAAWMEGAD